MTNCCIRWDGSFKRLSADDPEQMQCAERLYNQLYLEKYSRQNVQFTTGYLSQASQLGVLQLYGLFHQQQMVGVLGMVQLEQTVTVPIVGYRTELPASLALYRRLIAFALRYAMEHKLFLNLSSGAPDFKRVRGCQPVIEYSMVYVRHLNVYQRGVWALIFLAFPQGLSAVIEALSVMNVTKIVACNLGIVRQRLAI
ncbi:Uncharacterised protein [Serratia fonticola]|uniref:Uncharacterized protein n=1 Tax=Serratia fonticola TaxID=47917 RepID=A0A4U9TL94_SERFO|nr:Uncharacterised protein [Serratia fonticola]